MTKTAARGPIDISVCVAVYREHGPPNLASIAADLDGAADGLRWELVVFLNGMERHSAGVPAWAHTLHSKLNRGVPVAWNAAGRAARGEVIVFLNDDVELGASSLRFLWDALKEEGVGVVGPVGTQWDIVNARHRARLRDTHLPPGATQECNVISGFMFATPRAVFESVGGFDEAYTPCSFEEVDYCTAVRLRLRLRCLAVAGVRFRHRFGISSRSRWTRISFDGKCERIGRIFKRNRCHFLNKWKRLAIEGDPFGG